MELVEPIRSQKKINDMKNWLLGKGNIRNYALVVLGLNSALRITDILNLRWEDVYDFQDNIIKSHVYLKEKKTGKNKKFYLNKNAANSLLKLRRKEKKVIPSDFVFQSRQKNSKPLTRQMASNIIKEAALAVGIKDKIGCHSLRKSFGYHSWKKGVPLPLLTELFNHSTQQITKRYLGINQDDLDEVYKTVEL